MTIAAIFHRDVRVFFAVACVLTGALLMAIFTLPDSSAWLKVVGIFWGISLGWLSAAARAHALVKRALGIPSEP